MANATIDLRKLKNEIKSGRHDAEEEPRPELEESFSSYQLSEEATTSGALLEWSAPEFAPNADRGTLLLAAGALLVIGGIVAVILGNYLFAVFLWVAGGLVASYAFRKPLEIRSAVTSRGLVVSNRLYEFENLDSFWIFYDPPLFRELSLHSKKMFMPFVRVPLGELDPLRLRGVLLRFLKEEKQEESLIDIIAKRLGF